jgi:hypothetical protein
MLILGLLLIVLSLGGLAFVIDELLDPTKF